MGHAVLGGRRRQRSSHDLRVDRLLLGSDWPHAEGIRQPADFVTESLAGLPEDDVRRIGRENALELLGLSYD